jgi:hypothetical protein
VKDKCHRCGHAQSNHRRGTFGWFCYAQALVRAERKQINFSPPTAQPRKGSEMRQCLVCLAMVLMLRVFYTNADFTGGWGTVISTQLFINGKCYMAIRPDCCPGIIITDCGTIDVTRCEEVEANK